jgi:hypothetical protein
MLKYMSTYLLSWIRVWKLTHRSRSRCTARAHNNHSHHCPCCVFKRFKAGVDSAELLAAVARQEKIEIEEVAWHNVAQWCVVR